MNIQKVLVSFQRGGYNGPIIVLDTINIIHLCVYLLFYIFVFIVRALSISLRRKVLITLYYTVQMDRRLRLF